MEFYLTKKKPNPQKDRPLLTELGKSVCYEEPLHYTLFPNLMNVLQNTEWPYQFHGYYYWIRTKSDIFEEIIPASEYYKISYRAMSQKYHGALANYEEINRIIESLSDSYLRRRGQVGNSSQPKLVFTKELYTLRAEFSSLLFLIRAMLDQLAVLIQFLSGPRSRIYRSFRDVMVKATSEEPPKELDSKLCAYLCEHGDWFWKLRDMRDYIAHHGFVDLYLVETSAEKLRIYVKYHLEIAGLSQEFVSGLKSLMVCFDKCYAERISAWSQKS